MKFRQRFKRDKMFRLTSSLIILLIISIVVSNLPDKKTELTEQACNAIFDDSFDWGCWGRCIFPNPLSCFTCAGGISEDEFNLCQSQGCYVQASSSGENYEGLGTVQACWDKMMTDKVPLIEKCTLSVPTNSYVYDDESGCQFHEGYEVSDNLCGRPIYKCTQPADPEEACNAGEASVAKIVKSLGLDIQSCKTAYYVGIFGGGLVVLMMVGMIL